MATYPFLSEAWILETRRLREELSERANPPAAPPMKMNLVVTDVPDKTDPLDAHLDTSSGKPEIDLGHLPQADVKITVDFQTARAIFIEGNIGAAMEGLQLGRIKVDGDIMKVMSLAGMNADAGSIELAKRVRAITE